jgi:hypothetical protein
MENRIDRKDDESLYQPKIHSERIRKLYVLKEITGLPMTVLVDAAIREFLERNEENQKNISNQNEYGVRTTDRTDQAVL